MVQFLQQETYPTEFAFHKKLAQTEMLLELNWTHSLIVTEIALSLFDAGLFDTSTMERSIVVKAGLLFDIGVYVCGGFEWIPGQFPSPTPYVQHSVAGAQLLHQEGYADEIVRVALTHEGMGLTPEDIQAYGLALPAGDYIPSSPTQWLMCYSAKFHSKTPKFKTPEDIVTALERYGPEKAERFRQLQTSFGLPNIPAFQEKYGSWHTSFTAKIKQIQEGSVGGSAITIPVDLNPAGIAKNLPTSPV